MDDESLVSDCESYPAAAAESNRPRDRISELPDSLILSILSLMEMEDVVRTTVLSKRWKDLWTAVPCLDFRDSNRSFIDGALAKWNGDKILKFRIDFKDGDRPTSDMLVSWLLLPIEKQVEDLYLDFEFYVDPEFYAPQPLYLCSSITKLFLSNLKIHENVCVNVQWNQLKSVTIEGMHYVREGALNKILSGAPQLEELVLNLINICEELQIRSTSLKILRIGRFTADVVRDVMKEVVNSVQTIEAPNLLTLEVSSIFYYEDCSLDVPSLSNVIFRFPESVGELVFGQFVSLETFNRVFRSICHVEKVTLSAWCTEYLVYMKMNDMVVPFSNAEYLELETRDAHEILHVLEMFPNLKMLRVKLDEGLKYSLISGEIHTLMAAQASLPSPSLLQLKTVEITLSGWEILIIPLMLIRILLENANELEKMVLRLGRCFSNVRAYTIIEERVLSMPRSSPTAHVIVRKD